MSLSRMSTVFAAMLALGLSSVLFAQDAGKVEKIELAGGKVVLKVPESWKSVPPKSSIIQYEFVAPKVDAKADQQVRVTFMQSGGGVQANIDRWYGQFDQPDKSATKDKAKVEKLDVAGQPVHIVDISGTFKDTSGGGPFSQKPPVIRENYRMLGAIIETQNMEYYFKLTGPKEIVEAQVAGFKKMLKEMEVKK